METYSYPKSTELFRRASGVIPGGIYGHLGPAEGVFIPVSSYPLYIERAEGAYFWDVDGNRFIDYMCAYGPIVLGYNDEDVNRAATEQLAKADCAVLPAEKMVELAELLVDTVNIADWAFFAKNGGDVTNLAVMTARAYTDRDKVITHHGGYHGVAPWMQQPDFPGVTSSDVANRISTTFGDFEELKKAVFRNRGEVAAIISTPYHHPTFADNQLPPEGYWQKVRDLCDQEGILLIIDDIRAGFRLDIQGSDHHYGFEADLVTYCKALANGFNISALVGKDEYKEAAASVFYTGSYWLSAAPMAAAITCITKMREMNLPEVVHNLGVELTEGLVRVAAENQFEMVISGEPAMWFHRIAGFDGRDDPNFMLSQAWVGECVRRGVFFTNHHNHFINAAMTSDDIAYTLDVADDAFKAVAKRAGTILGRGY